MRLNDEHIKALQELLKELCSLEYTDEQAQMAGMAIMRFVAEKVQRERDKEKLEQLIKEEQSYA
jgi:hypothetical protein